MNQYHKGKWHTIMKRVYNIFAEAIEYILKLNMSSAEYTQISAKIFNDGMRERVQSGLPLQLMGSNGVWKEISPSIVNSAFCDELEKYYYRSIQEENKENVVLLVYGLDKGLKHVSDADMCIEKTVEEIMPLNTNSEETQILLFSRVNCRWEHKSQGRCYKNNLEIFMQNFLYIKLEDIKGIKVHNYMISQSFFRKLKKKKGLKIAVSPITNQDVIVSEEYERDGNLFFHINALKNEEIIKNNLLSIIENAIKNKVDVLLFPEMLGREHIIKDIQGTCDFAESPMLVVWPSVWKNTRDNKENSNTSILTLHKGKNVYEVCRQYKRNSYVTPSNAIEDLALQDPWEVNILSCKGVGRIGILICKDFLIDDNRKLLSDILKTTLILVPSYTTGEHNFEILLTQKFQNDCNIAWCNTCSATAVEGAKIENFNTIAAITSYGVQIDSVIGCVHCYDGVARCTNKNCKDCMFIGEIPFA